MTRLAPHPIPDDIRRMRWIAILGTPAALWVMPAFSVAQETDTLNAAKIISGHNGDGVDRYELVFEPVETRFLRIGIPGDSKSAALSVNIAEIDLLPNQGSEPLNKEKWKVLAASGTEADRNHPVSAAIDGDTVTYWFCDQPSDDPRFFMELDLGEKTGIAGIRYVPCQDSSVPGRIGEVFLQTRPADMPWGAPVIRGIFVSSATRGSIRPSWPPPEVPSLQRRVFAKPALVKAPVAIDVDSKGRVFVAETRRYNGRGVFDNRGKSKREEEDLRTTTLEQRRAALLRWEKEGELDQERKRNAGLFEDNESMLTKFSENIALLTDENGDGTADRRTIFSEGFSDILDGPAAGVLATDDGVYFTCIPHLWKLRDTDNDGVADEKESLSYGYGIRTGWFGHDLHGLIQGPDGRIYFSMADRGFHVRTREGKVWFGPGTGGVFRCWPDGSELELFAQGLRNPQELAFDDRGNLFTGDNNCDAGDQARLVYLVEGGDSGWNMTVQSLDGRGPWLTEGMWELRGETDNPRQPAWIVPPISYIESGPSGFAFYPGTGLPESYGGYFFLCDYRGGHGSIQSFSLRPDGAGFRSGGHHVFDRGPTVSDIDFGYDGRIFVSEWGPGWDIHPSAQIYTLEHPPSRAKKNAREVARLFRNGFKELTPVQLERLLDHEDMRVRQASQFELAREKKAAVLQRVASSSANSQSARIHAIWGLGQIARSAPGVLQSVADLAIDEDPEIRAQSIRTLGDLKYRSASESCLQALTDAHPRVRFFAAYAVGKTAPDGATQALLELLRDNADRDAYLRHAAVMGLFYLNSPDELLGMTGYFSSPAVRLGVVLLLRRLGDPRVAQFIEDRRAVVSTETARAIYDQEMDSVMNTLAKALSKPPSLHPAFLHRSIEAGLRLGRTEDADRLVRFALREEMPITMRAAALQALVNWDEPPPREGVWGRWRPVPERMAYLARDAVRKYLPNLDQLNEPSLSKLIVRLESLYGEDKTDEQLVTMVGSKKSAANRRAEALLTLEKRDGYPKTQLIELCQNALDTANSSLVRSTALQVWARNEVTSAVPLLVRTVDRGQTFTERQISLDLLSRVEDERAVSFLNDKLQDLVKGALSPAIQLDVYQLGKTSGRSEFEKYVEQFDAANGEEGVHRLALEGGDPEHGKRVFSHNQATQCLRCHAVAGKGGDVGPPLDRIGSRRSREKILEGIVNPQAEVVLGYGVQSVTLKDGTIVTGLLTDETDGEIKIKEGDESRTIPKSEVTSRTPSISGMPPMGALLKPEELRDVIAYLYSLK